MAVNNLLTITAWLSLALLLLQLTSATAQDAPAVDKPLNTSARGPFEYSPDTRHGHSNSLPVWDCSDLPYGTPSGVYSVLEGAEGPPVWAYCELSNQETGSWTVLQRRMDTVGAQLSFFRYLDEYRYGFGELDSEFWWGLEHMWRMTSRQDRVYELRIDMEDWVGLVRYALYGEFHVSSYEGWHRLFVSSFSGDAGDSLSYHSGMRFSAPDYDNDASTAHCGSLYSAGWWYKACHEANLNGIYFGNNNPTTAQNGVLWSTWHGFYYSMKTVEMKIRPRRKLTSP